MVHCRPETEACRSFPMEGRAMLTIVTSRPTIRRLMEQMRRMPMRRLRLSSLIAVGPPQLLVDS